MLVTLEQLQSQTRRVAATFVASVVHSDTGYVFLNGLGEVVGTIPISTGSDDPDPHDPTTETTVEPAITDNFDVTFGNYTEDELSARREELSLAILEIVEAYNAGEELDDEAIEAYNTDLADYTFTVDTDNPSPITITFSGNQPSNAILTAVETENAGTYKLALGTPVDEEREPPYSCQMTVAVAASGRYSAHSETFTIYEDLYA